MPLPEEIFLRDHRLFNGRTLDYAAALIEAKGAESKRTGRNQVLRKNDMASLKNWAG